MSHKPDPIVFWAHSGTPGDFSDWQSLPDHARNTARLAAQRAAVFGLLRAASLLGLMHDLGKYAPDVQARIKGADTQAEHSTAGAAVLRDLAENPGDKGVAQLLGYAIAGHHAGLPDMRSEGNGSLAARLEGFATDLPAQWRDDLAPDFTGVMEEILAHVRRGEHAAFDFSLVVRMLFSCLVDADFRDTEAYYDALQGVARDRDWPDLAAHLDRHTAALEAHLAGLGSDGAVNAIRRRVLDHVRAKATMPPGLFTLTVPTGGGKTLTSLAFALDHARAHGLRRVIFAIPFTSIIDQTAETFRNILGAAHVLEHHSAIDDRRSDKADRDKLKLAMEDWAAPFVVTTAVQFFESLFAARPSRARKLHNIAGSVIILDEAQTLPRPLLLPCLRMLDALARHYGCSIVLCTATQPAVSDDRLKGGLPLAGRELAPDPAGLGRELRRARITHGGDMDNDALVAALAGQEQALMIVNSRAQARDLYQAARHLDGVIHLTTRQYARHRQQIIADIRRRLTDGSPCRVIATSLIEAGVDVDFPTGWRAEAGLDQIVQAAGRINRGGRRPVEDSVLTVFRPVGYSDPPEIKGLIKDTAGIMARHGDLLSLAAMDDYFSQVYWRIDTHGGLDAEKILPRLKMTRTAGSDFAFRSIAKDFRMIESGLAPVIVATEPLARAIVGRLAGEESSGKLARELQGYVVQVPPHARDAMIASGAVGFVSKEQRGDQFAVLTRDSLYDPQVGLIWEDAEVLGAGDLMF